MEQSARSISTFAAYCNDKGLKIALISPTSAFLGSYIAEALLAQNIAVVCETANPAVFGALEHLKKNLHFFLYEHAKDSGPEGDEQYNLLLDTLRPAYIIFNVDEAVKQFLGKGDLFFSITLRTKHLISCALKNDARFLLLSEVDASDDISLPRPLPHKQLSLSFKEKQREIKHYVTTVIAESIETKSLNARVISYADVFGPRMEENAESEIATLITEAVDKKNILLHGDGLTLIRPLYITDFTYGVIKALFSNETKNKAYVLVHPIETTVLEIAKLLQKTGEEFALPLSIAFTNEEKEPSFTLRGLFNEKTLTELAWEPKVTIDEGMRRTFAFFFPQVRPRKVEIDRPVVQAPIVPTPGASVTSQSMFTQYPPKPTENSFISFQIRISKPKFLTKKTTIHADHTASTQTKLPKKSSKIQQVFKGLTLLFLFLFILLALPIGFYYLKVPKLNSIGNLAGSQQSSETRLKEALTELEFNSKLFPLSAWYFAITKQSEQYNTSKFTLALLTEVIHSQLALKQADTAIYKILHPPQSGIEGEIDKATLQTRMANQRVAFAKALQKNTGTQNTTITNAIAKSEASSTIFSNFLALVQTIFASPKDQTFAILVTDANTLRPSGGVVTGVIYATLSPNKEPNIKKYALASIATVSAVTAPQSYKTATRNQPFTFANSLWDVPFNNTIAPYLKDINLINGSQVLGVINLTTTSFKPILSAIGPVRLQTTTDDEKRPITVNEGSVETVLNTLVYSKTTLAQTEKEAIINDIAYSILTELFRQSKDFQAISTTLSQQYRQKNIAFYTADPALQLLGKQQGWAQVDTGFENDSFSITDAAIGLSQSTQVKKTIRHDIIVSARNMVSERMIIAYSNAGQTDYQSYSRIYLPIDRTLLRVTADNKRILQQTEEVINGKKVIGTMITAPANMTTILTIEYDRVNPLPFTNNKTTLLLNIMKQYGESSMPYELSIQLPPTLKRESSIPSVIPISTGSTTATAKDTLDSNKSYYFILSK